MRFSIVKVAKMLPNWFSERKTSISGTLIEKEKTLN